MHLTRLELTDFRCYRTASVELPAAVILVTGANGQGKTRQEALDSLSAAISLILQDRREDGLRGIPPEATRDTVIVK